MIEQLPLYVPVVFILTTLLTVWIFLSAIRRSRKENLPAKLLLFLIPFWIVIQAILGVGKFYQNTDGVPPRVIAFGVLPSLLLIAVYFIFFRKDFVERLPLETLTLLHIIRIPVEIVLFWLFQNGQIPQIMTFEGRNFDILSGLTAPIIYLIVVRTGKINRPLLISWNVIALALLINIVTIAFLSLKSSLQKPAFEQPNIAVAYFPFIWLPTVVVPIVLFSHLAILWKLFRASPNKHTIESSV